MKDELRLLEETMSGKGGGIAPCSTLDESDNETELLVETPYQSVLNGNKKLTLFSASFNNQLAFFSRISRE